MLKPIQLRPLTAEEESEIRRLAASRNGAGRLAKRARLIVTMLDNPDLPATLAGFKAGFRGRQSGVTWVKRFNQEGLAGLEDRPKPGRPAVHDPQVRSELIHLALKKPDSLGYPFKLWTLERLQAAFREHQSVQLSCTTIWEWVAAEGFDWKRKDYWYQENRITRYNQSVKSL
jgi:transposase